MKEKIINLLKKIFTKYQFVVCSRNLTTNDKNSLYWKIAEKYNIEQILKENPTLTIKIKEPLWPNNTFSPCKAWAKLSLLKKKS